MKIVIVSDIHGNFGALSALPESYDELWVLGDLYELGPEPKEVVDFVTDNATLVVRGNHDQCIGYSETTRDARPVFEKWRKRRGSFPIRS